MKTIGLIGGIASGKSAVSAALARRGAQVFDADKIGHQLLDQPDVRDELVKRWGPELLDESSRIDRKKIAAHVFQNTDESAADLTWLEQLLHPRIRQHIESEIAQLSLAPLSPVLRGEGPPYPLLPSPGTPGEGLGVRAQPSTDDPKSSKRRALVPDLPAIVIDAPLLLESSWNEACQVIAFVDSPREERLRRAQERGWTPEEFTRRELAQMPIEQKRRWATHVIDNSGSLADLETQVAQFWTDAIPESPPDQPEKSA